MATPSAEELEKMLEFLSQLEILKKNNPQLYMETVQALGLPTPPSTATAGTEETSDPLAMLYQSIKDFQSSSQGNEKVKVAMPDGKSILGKEGMENKVLLRHC